MSLVREAARRSEYLIQAKAAPFQARQLLKERGYRWRPEDLKNGKVWWTITSNPEAELAWLAKDVYQAAIDLPVTERNEVMLELGFMGITAGSLFPEIDGTCEAIKELYFLG